MHTETAHVTLPALLSLERNPCTGLGQVSWVLAPLKVEKPAITLMTQLRKRARKVLEKVKKVKMTWVARVVGRLGRGRESSSRM